jgi:hypothetical protein
MSGMADLPWYKRYGEGIMIGVLASAVFAVISILADRRSSWFSPIFYGLIASVTVAMVCVAVLLLRRVPRARLVPSEKNIESFIRTWLDNCKVTVKNDPCVDAYFRLRITLDGGEYLTIIRSKSDYPGYVQIVADLGVRGDDQKLLDQFTEDEITGILLDIKMALAQAKVGYSGLIHPPENFHLFRRVPIYPSLTEFAFVSMIGDVEAATHLVKIVFLKTRLKKDKQLRLVTPLSASDIPKLEPPIA